MQANTFAAGLLGRDFKSRPSTPSRPNRPSRPNGPCRPNGVWRTCIIGLVLAGLAASASASVTSITGVNVVNKPDRVVMTVAGSEPLRMSVLASKTGSYLGFQFAGRLVAKGGLVSINSGRICNVRYSRFAENPPLTRVVLNTTCRRDYSTQWNTDKTRVEITVWKFGASPARAPGRPAQAEAAAPPAEDSLPALPPAAIGEAQGSDTTEAADPSPVKVTPVPAAKSTRGVARIAPPAALARIAQAFVTPASSGAGRKVSLNFLGADINDVLKALAVQSQENIVVGSDVTGTITVTLDAVTVEEALDYITQLSGYTYVKDQHTYLVGSTDTVGGLANAKVEIITLSYANADDVLEMLKAQCPQIRSSKISVRGGMARKHEQTFEQGRTKSDASGQANINSQGQANVNAQGQADVNAQGNSSGASKSGSGNATVNASGGAAGQTTSNAQGTMNINAKRGTESLASSTATDSPPSNMIALVGTVEKIASAKAFIAQVEDAMKSQSADRKVAVYSVKYVNTAELANTLMSIVMGVTISIAPSDETWPAMAAGDLKIVPVNLLSGENSNRAFDTKTVPFSHTLIIVGKEADVQKALDMAAQFDVPGEQDLATYKVKYVDINLLAATIRKLVPSVTAEGIGVASAGKDGASAGGNGAPTPGGGAGSTSVADTAGSQGMIMSTAALDNLSRMLVITGRKGDVEKARTLIEALDVKSPQIKIEAKITSLTETGEKKLGLSWNWTAFSKVEVPQGGNDSHWQRQPINFGATLDALITNGDGKLLAAPSLVCLEGKPGMFFVGDQIRFVTQISAAVNGVTTVTTDTANVGIQLSVVGNVASDGYITLNLHPEVSVPKFDEVSSPGLALTLPTITRRFTDHVVRVKSGETIVIGGLIKDDELDTLKKVPLLGDLPVLGHLFRHRDKTKDHSEVVIFITASIVND